jgi:hypothetical protein
MEPVLGIMGKEHIWWGLGERLQLGRHSSAQDLLQDYWFLVLGSNHKLRGGIAACLSIISVHSTNLHETPAS